MDDDFCFDDEEDSSCSSSTTEPPANYALKRPRSLWEAEQAIEKARKRHGRMLYQHWQASILMRLQYETRRAWDILDDWQRQDKDHLMAVLKSKSDLPVEMRRNDFWNDLPAAVQEDEELFLARIKRLGAKDSIDIPGMLKGNKEVMLALVARCPSVVRQEQLSEKLYNDVDIYRAFLDKTTSDPWAYEKRYDDEEEEKPKKPPELPLYRSYLFLFSEELRNNADLMIETFQKHYTVDKHGRHFIEDYEYHSKKPPGSWLGDQLRHNVDFWLRFARQVKIPADYYSLDHVPKSLRGHVEIAKGFCARRGILIHCLVEPAKSHVDVIRAALAQDLSLCAAVRWDTSIVQPAVNDKTFLLSLCGNSTGNSKSAHAFWKWLDASMKSDREVMLSCMVHLSQSKKVLPDVFEMWKGDSDLWSRVLEQRPKLWRKLPDALRSQPALARAAARNIDSPFLATSPVPLLLQHHSPDVLLADIDVLRAIVMYYGRTEDELFEHVKAAFSRLAPREQKKIALVACCTNAYSYQLLDGNLKQDRDILEKLLSSHSITLVITWIPSTVQRMYPDLIAQGILRLDLLDSSESHFDLQVLLDRQVAKAYFARCHYPSQRLTDAFLNDEEMMLVLLKRKRESFFDMKMLLPQGQSYSKNFLFKVLETQPSAFPRACDNLEDSDLLLAAIATDTSLVMWAEETDMKRLIQFAEEVHERADLVRCFDLFLAALTDKTFTWSVPSRLNQGKETSLVYQQLIAEYIGVPDETTCQRLRAASATLKRWGY